MYVPHIYIQYVYTYKLCMFINAISIYVNEDYCLKNWNLFGFSDIEAECQDDYMKIRIGFNGSFTGLVYSAGKHILLNFSTSSTVFSLSYVSLFNITQFI